MRPFDANLPPIEVYKYALESFKDEFMLVPAFLSRVTLVAYDKKKREYIHKISPTTLWSSEDTNEELFENDRVVYLIWGHPLKKRDHTPDP